MKKFNKLMIKIAVISAIICVVAFGALFIITRSNDAKEHEIVGAYGTTCTEKQCKIAIYDGAPGFGEISFYYLVNSDQISDVDMNEYFYLVNYTREEMDSFGYDVSEGSNEDKIFGYTSKYAIGYYYY